MSSFRPRRRADDEPAAAPKPGSITDIQPQRRDNARVSVYIDGMFAFGLHIDLQLEHYLKKGDVLDEEKIALLLKQDAVKKAISTSLNLIAYRPRSAGELASKLRERGYDAETIDEAIGRMRELNYLDDREFADRWVESRQMHRPRSTRMLRQELQQKGVDRQIIESTIEGAGIDEFGDALALGQKKVESFRALEPQVRDRRLSGFLARRGYSYDVIRRVLEALETGETVDGQ
ncbi:MAG TPA: RecX family transcriptional regulator [Thermomicrobiales bacterium]|nr:RecX family transcriptional regulator [Thermomicrobiales bacterium]